MTLRRTLAALGLALCTACVTTAQEGEQMRQDIAQLKQQLQAQRDELATQQAQKSKELQDALDQLNRASRKSGADLAVDLEKAQNDVAALRGQNETLQHRLEQVEQQLQQQSKQLDDTGKFVQQRQKELEHPTDRAGIYAAARKAYDAGQYPRARELFAEFVQKFPRDEMAASSQYWLGETDFAEKRYNDAIVEFQKVVKQYKGSDKVPQSLLRIGMSFAAEGDCQNAALFFEEVQQSHRGTESAKEARQQQAKCRKRRGAGR